MSPLYDSDGIAQARAHPVLQAIDILLSGETPAARFMRENGPAISAAHAEMMDEREAER